ncbi:MAG: endo alpha-1,4 polygalactosaminidase [Bacteroidales bacterium]|jgi:cysteinyl-tRNA synthetase|nr:endo alpha-1,4 polygalactosaminidase [Bacteroidales bacterium]
MKKLLFISLILSIFISCSDDEEDENLYPDLDFKQEMRDFVTEISQYAKAKNPNFAIIPQNEHELVSDNGDTDGSPDANYNNAIDACGQEDLFYGYVDDDVITGEEDNEYLTSLLDISKSAGNVILVTDYCYTHSKMDDSYSKNNAKDYISFAADDRELSQIPDYPLSVYNENSEIISDIHDVQNFLYLINPSNYASKTEFVNAIKATNYDLLIMDFFFGDNEEFNASEIEQLKQKANGGTRLIVSYMSIGEAEDYRYYWNESWAVGTPTWLKAENPEWEGNYKVEYWNTDWKAIILGSETSYLDKIIDAGFDGVYLDIIEAFEYFE